MEPSEEADIAEAARLQALHDQEMQVLREQHALGSGDSDSDDSDEEVEDDEDAEALKLQAKLQELHDLEMRAVREQHGVKSGDSDDNDSDDGNEISMVEEQTSAVPEVVSTPTDYNGHLAYIKLLQTSGDLERLREAREAMSQVFPLSPQLWLSWIEDERKSPQSSTSQGRDAIVKLFDRAVADYVSVDIWIEYVHFTIGYMAEPEGSVDKVRDVFERAIMACGLHVAKGALLWEAFREFENLILSTLIAQDKDKNKQLAGQLKQMANLFKRQLSIPLLNMEKTYDAFEQWLEAHAEIWTVASEKPVNALIEKKNVEMAYKKALEKLHKLSPFEDVLASCAESDKVTHYKEYLKFEQSLGDPIRLMCLFERALTDCPLDAPLWLGYIESFEDINMKEITLKLCERSVRNCPWYALLWQQYLRSMEKSEVPHQKIKGVLEEAIKAGMQNAEDYRNVWLDYCAYLRRRIDWGTETEKEVLTEFRETVRAAFDQLNQYFGQDGDPACHLLRMLATVEAVHSRQMEEARKTWNDILNQGHKNSAASWLQYIHLEMAYGDSKHLRKLFPRALQSVQDWPESIVEEWIQFERTEGTLESYEEAMFKCRTRIKQVTAEREKAAAAEETQQQNKAASKQGRNQKDDRNQTNLKQNWKQQDTTTSSETRKSALKRPAPQESESVTAVKKSVPPPPGYKPDKFDKPGSPKKPKLDSAAEHGVVTEHDPSKDNRTAFVSNLDYATDADKIRKVFENVGNITELRLVKDFKGRSKGFCFVVFSSHSEMVEALKKDREPIDGRPIFVSKCDPDRHTRQHGFKYSTNLEKNKLFVKGLPLSTTKEDLEKLFGEYGRLKEVRPVVYRNGHFKGLAYVDFEDEVSAAHALIKIDGMVMGDKTISVAISQPPDRRTSLLSEQEDSSAPLVRSLGGGQKEVGARGRGRTQVSFVPRALQVKSDSVKDQASTSGSNGTAPLKSNADFRQLLLGKK